MPKYTNQMKIQMLKSCPLDKILKDLELEFLRKERIEDLSSAFNSLMLEDYLPAFCWGGAILDQKVETEELRELRECYAHLIRLLFMEKRASRGALELEGHSVYPCYKCGSMSVAFGNFSNTEELKRTDKAFLDGLEYVVCEAKACHYWKSGKTKEIAVKKWNEAMK